MQQFGTTTDDFEEITDYHQTPDSGLRVFGSIKNTGSKGLTFRITVNDVYGNTDVASQNCNAGKAVAFSVLNSNVGPNTVPPYLDLLIEVASLTTGEPTTWQYQDVEF